MLEGHSYAVRKVRCSPYAENLVASTSYDFTTRYVVSPGRVRIWMFVYLFSDHAKFENGGNSNRVWNTRAGRCDRIFNAHTEFTVGLAWSLHEPGILADTSWDTTVKLYRTF